MGHPGEAYLSQNISVVLNELDMDLRSCEKHINFSLFSTSVFPKAEDILPFEGRNCDKVSVQLAEHLRYLLADPLFDESYRELKLSVVARLYPQTTEGENRIVNCWYCVTGPFMDYFEQLSAGKTLIFKVKLTNFFNTELKECWQDVKLFELAYLKKGERVRSSGTFSFNSHMIPGMIDMFNGRPFSGKKGDAKLSVAMCADLSERMMLPLPIISPNGMSYQLPVSLGLTLAERKKHQFMNSGSVNLIAANGTKIECNYNYLIESRPVFQTMLNGDRFEEARSRTIDMSDMTEDGVKSLINYLSCFDLELPLKQFSIALQLLQASEKYGIDALKTTITTMLLSKKCEDYEIGDALSLFTYCRLVESMADLRNKALKVLKLKSDQLSKCRDYEQLFVKEPFIAMELCTTILQLYSPYEKNTLN